MTLNGQSAHASRSSWHLLGVRPYVTARWLRLALVALDVETLAAHGHDQSLVDERGQGPLGCAVWDS